MTIRSPFSSEIYF